MQSRIFGGSYELGAFVGNLVGGVAGSMVFKYGSCIPKRVKGCVDLDAPVRNPFGNHEMNSHDTPKVHFHAEEWIYDFDEDIMRIKNTLIRLKQEVK